MKNKNYICHVSYLANNVAYGHDFRYTYVIWWDLQVFFFFFKLFGLLGGGGVGGGQKAKNGPKW